MKIQRPELRRARIEIIPMIDTIFFLLVFFMFSSLSMIRMRGMNISLPRRTSTAAPAVQATGGKLILTVTPAGEYYINTTRIQPAEIERVLDASVAINPNVVVVINVAKTQTTGTLVGVMDSINQSNHDTGKDVPVLIATEAVDLNGNAVSSTPAPFSAVGPSATSKIGAAQ